MPHTDGFGNDCVENDTLLYASMRRATVYMLKTICERLESIDNAIGTRQGRASLVDMMADGLGIRLPLQYATPDDCTTLLASFFLARSRIVGDSLHHLR
jgi:hypothetical protein